MERLITIGVPVYNGERYLAQCLDSVLAQSGVEFEIIIGDNASTDGTWSICQAYAMRDTRIHLLRHDRNLGAARNYNALVEKARGKYFKWMPHDDLIAPQYLDRCAKALDQDPGCVLVYPTTVIIDSEGRHLTQDPIDHLEVDAMTPHERLRQYFLWSSRNPGCNAVLGLIRTSVLRETDCVGSYPSSDKVLLAELALHGRFIHLPDPLFFRRDHLESSLKTHPDLAARAAWFDTEAQDTQEHMEIRWVREYLGAIRRAAPAGMGFALCLRSMGLYYQLRGHKIRRELKHRLRLTKV
jgi:glycosyltransferase involved in cell wall biosynthesis